ncbi:hypothetical protein L249_6932 [Ophiocordyceps polyrhachis-furcata BCC 54312]|uniref:G-patch domain-containing protein n=1 Tax=Ophiocordyceps polyrhachis-furcata BCC 54312 TaxID=1330021 RepID=A0A367LJV4_9HYPO|nr:hypothetical protein L249_6932 [Ophiocordyceps polyrhachis-furcata BCC 54312]
MAGSQLKRLKASLREQGITGPQQSKKQKRKAAQDSRARGEKKLQRGLVLDGIRQQFNPFDLKHNARGPKFEVTTNRPVTGDVARGIKGRPTQARAAGEERRKQTLLVEMQRRNKVGGILDRRFGENDPTMAPEEKMLERFALEKQRSHRKRSLFDLEDEETSEVGLTHMGKSLTFDDEPADDFHEEDLDAADDSDGSVRERQRLKRVRSMAAVPGEEEEAEQPERKKTKKEVMQEIIAKSKMYKHERQAAKEDDEDMRVELDKELSDIRLLLSTTTSNAKRSGHGELSVPTIGGTNRDAFEKEYDLQVKRLAQDRRAQPTERIKTDEERAKEESERLQKLEERRQKRMRGEEVSDTDSDSDGDNNKALDTTAQEEEVEDEFGLGSGLRTRPTAKEVVFDDEDDFVIDDDLVASGSDFEEVESDDEDDVASAQGEADVEEDDEDEFTKGLLNEEETSNPIFKLTSTPGPSTTPLPKSDNDGLPYTFPCPQSYEDFKALTEAFPRGSLPTIVQRIRALYHPKLDSKNKERLAGFAAALVDFVSSPWEEKTRPPFSVLESLVRHIHSLAKMFPVEVGSRFRHHIGEMGRERPLALRPSDLILLTAVGTIFPTSDHFHQVVTPAMLVMSWYLGQCVPREMSDYAVGVFLSALTLQYQQMSKRYVPEVMNFCLNALCALSPVSPTEQLGNFPQHEPPRGIRMENAQAIRLRPLRFTDCDSADVEGEKAASLKAALFDTCIRVVEGAAELWSGKSAFLETFEQAARVLKHSRSEGCLEHLPTQLLDRAEKVEVKLGRMIRLAQLSRRPLELHHHRPLAIKTFIPRFEERFDPDKHYDPDRERAELAKLKAEHKRERKGVMRELRKDANFMAREKLRIKKAKDEAYEKKYKRLIAEIQGEEGREANEYEREKKAHQAELLSSIMSLPYVKKETSGDEDDDYMKMTFDDANRVQESSLQRTRRLKKESHARGFVKSKSSLAAETAAARDKALSMSLLENPRTKNSKGLAMMNKMGFTGGALGSGPDSSGPTEPLKPTIKEDRGGIGHEPVKKRRPQRDAAANEHETKVPRTEPGEYRERNRNMHAEGRLRGKMHGLQRIAMELDDKVSYDANVRRPPLKDLPVVYRGKVRRRERKLRDERARRQTYYRRPMCNNDEADGDDRMALGLDRDAKEDVVDELDETDDELDSFEAMAPRDQFIQTLSYLRYQHRYCFWCKMMYPNDKMEGCPGLLEEDHY